MAENMRKREEIEAKYKWDLTAIFPSDREWEQALNAATEHVAGAAAFDGRVAEDPKGAIRTYQALIDEIIPIYEYAFLRKETDNTDPQAQALKDRAMRLYVMGMPATAFLQPELLALPEETLEALEKDPEMKDFDAMIRQVRLGKPHTLPKEQERLIAMMGEVAAAPQNIFSALSDADMKFPPVRMADGTEQELTEGN